MKKNVLKYKSFDDIQGYLDRLGMFHMDLSLARMEAFATAWKAARPSPEQSRLPAVHVVGTNGKGSTSVFLECIAREHGLITGLYSSPHFLTPRERIRVQGQMLEASVWVQLANDLQDLCPDLELTYFEWLTCLAALAFESRAVDIAVMEAGLGGRYDATRVFAPRLVLLTPVGLDHQAWLGDTLAAIADDKSRAITSGCIAITAPQRPEVMEVYERRAEAVGATLSVARPMSAQDVGGPLGLAGEFQSVNAGLALAGWQAWCTMRGLKSDPAATLRGLRQAWLPGRMQIVPASGGHPAFVLDGGHNGHGLHAVRRSLAAAGIRPDAVIFGCMRDKDVQEMRHEILRISSGPVYATGISGNDRAMDCDELAQALGERGVAAKDVEDALGQAMRVGAKNIMVAGSLYLLSEFYRLHPHLLDPAH